MTKLLKAVRLSSILNSIIGSICLKGCERLLAALFFGEKRNPSLKCAEIRRTVPMIYLRGDCKFKKLVLRETEWIKSKSGKLWNLDVVERTNFIFTLLFCVLIFNF